MSGTLEYFHVMHANEVRFERIGQRGLPITITVNANSSGRLHKLADNCGTATSLPGWPLTGLSWTDLNAGGQLVLMPDDTDANYRIECLSGTISLKAAQP